MIWSAAAPVTILQKPGYEERKYIMTNKESLAHFEKNRKLIEECVDKEFATGIRNIFLIGCGGTYSLMLPWKYFADTNTDLPVYAEIAPELVLQNHRQLGEGSLCIFVSASGNTEDIIASMKYCRQRGAKLISILTKEECPMAELSDYVFTCTLENDFSIFFCGLAQIICRILFLRGEFEKYERFADQLYNIGESLDKAVELANTPCIYYAARNHNAPWHLVVGSGATWGEAYCYAMCIMEEMQWLHTKSINAAEFFHGTIELMEKDTPVIMFVGEDTSRPLMERVYNFIKPLTNEILWLDAKDVELPVDEEFKGIFSPAVVAAMSRPLSKALESQTNHSLTIRRFYRQMKY